jgi:succinate dehydrogenase / fumarate reductase flavoprotein subunit
MFEYVPDVFRPQYADNEKEADAWYKDPDHNKRTPDLLPRDEVARAINSEVKAGRGSPHGGVFLDIASRLPKEEILRRLPSMHHQFKELADVDITAEPMEVGPTCHYVMGGIEVDADTAAAARVPGLFASGEVAGGMHGSNRLGGNSLSDLLVFGRRSGEGAAAYVKALGGKYPAITDEQIAACERTALAPIEKQDGENPYSLHEELQQVMNDLVGIIRKRSEIEDALDRLEKLKERAQHLKAPGAREFNPGWHLALDLRNMLSVAECVAKAALIREESRGGHTRDDFPKMSSTWRQVNLICSLDDEGDIDVVEQPMPPMREDLMALFTKDELKKYFTDGEISSIPDDNPDIVEKVEAAR